MRLRHAVARLVFLTCSFLVTNACSFLVTNVELTPALLERANFWQRFRGPDLTQHVRRGPVSFVHNLLHMTGAYTPQPFVDRSAVALFNGEIYNWRELASELGVSVASDGEVLLPLWRRYGEAFPLRLKGEFSVVVADLERDVLLLSTDVFGTKPFWRAGHETDTGTFGVASYASALELLGLAQPIELDPNTVELRQLSTFGLLRVAPLHTFDLRQYKTSLDDWNAAFNVSMERRLSAINHHVFIGLSSGYDSGAIALNLVQRRKRHHIYSIVAQEHLPTVSARHAFAEVSGVATTHLIHMRNSSYHNTKEWLGAQAEPYSFDRNWNASWARYRPPSDYRDDPGSIGLSYLCRLAHPLGIRIYLSGNGVDEIYTEYNGNTPVLRTLHKGHFPKQLEPIFPWPMFYGGHMRNYLRQSDYVAGAHGMEGRYPFLDVDLVQEFLWLTYQLKNTRKKHPLHEYMANARYPLQVAKFGFNSGFKLAAGADETSPHQVEADSQKPGHSSAASLYPVARSQLGCQARCREPSSLPHDARTCSSARCSRGAHGCSLAAVKHALPPVNTSCRLLEVARRHDWGFTEYGQARTSIAVDAFMADPPAHVRHGGVVLLHNLVGEGVSRSKWRLAAEGAMRAGAHEVWAMEHSREAISFASRSSWPIGHPSNPLREADSDMFTLQELQQELANLAALHCLGPADILASCAISTSSDPRGRNLLVGVQCGCRASTTATDTAVAVRQARRLGKSSGSSLTNAGCGDGDFAGLFCCRNSGAEGNQTSLYQGPRFVYTFHADAVAPLLVLGQRLVQLLKPAPLAGPAHSSTSGLKTFASVAGSMSSLNVLLELPQMDIGTF